MLQHLFLSLDLSFWYLFPFLGTCFGLPAGCCVAITTIVYASSSFIFLLSFVSNSFSEHKCVCLCNDVYDIDCLFCLFTFLCQGYHSIPLCSHSGLIFLPTWALIGTDKDPQITLILWLISILLDLGRVLRLILRLFPQSIWQIKWLSMLWFNYSKFSSVKLKNANESRTETRRYI